MLPKKRARAEQEAADTDDVQPRKPKPTDQRVQGAPRLRTAPTPSIKKLNAMPVKVRRRVYCVCGFQKQALLRTEERRKAGDRLAMEFQLATQSLMDAQKRLIRGIPQFWLHVFRHYEPTAVMITPRDAEVLHHLTDVVSTFVDGWYKLSFHFAPNKFFTDGVLTKRYFVDRANKPNCAVGCTIHWTSQQCNATLRGRLKRDVSCRQNGQPASVVVVQERVHSFFNFFTHSSTAGIEKSSQKGERKKKSPLVTDRRAQQLQQMDFSLGMAICRFVIRRAVFVYSGQHIENVSNCWRTNGIRRSGGEINPITLMHEAASAGCAGAVVSLLRGGVPVGIPHHDGETPLHTAARRGRLATCELLLKYGAEVDARSNRQATPMHVAAIEGHADVVQLLLNHRGGCAARDKNGQTPLAVAASAVSPSCIKLLLAAGASPTDVDNEGDTAVHALFNTLAAVFNDDDDPFIADDAADDTEEVRGGAALLDGVEGEACAASELRVTRQKALHRGMIVLACLIEAGADPMRPNNEGRAPILVAMEQDLLVPYLSPFLKAVLDANTTSNDHLHSFVSIAAESSNPEMLQLLLARGADAVTVDNNGWSPLVHAANGLSVPCVAVLLGVPGLIESERLRNGPGVWATTVFQACCVDRYYNSGAVERLPEPSRTAVLEERLAKLLKIGDLILPCRFLIDQQADGFTPLTAAASEDALHPALRLFIAQGADLNFRNTDGVTALLQACNSRAERNALYLVECGADTALVDARGNTPLMLAARRGLSKAVDALLAAGASVAAVNSNQQGALHHALEQAIDQSLQGTECVAQFEETVIAIVKKCAAFGANVNAADASHLTPMHCAAKLGNVNAIRLLHALGGHVMPGTCPIDPLILAVSGAKFPVVPGTGFLPAVECLLELGASPQGRDTFRFGPGPSALHFAASLGNLPVVEALLGANADVFASDEEGSTALSRAAEMNCTDVIARLVAAGCPIDAADNAGATALHRAAAGGHLEAATLLLSLGASAKIKSHSGSTAAMQAASGCHSLVLEAMLDRDDGCAAVDNFLVAACHRTVTVASGTSGSGEDCADTLRLLLSRGANVNNCRIGLAPLHLIASLGGGDAESSEEGGSDDWPAACESVAFLRLLMSPSNTPAADPNIRDFSAATPLHHAAGHHNVAGAALLIAAGADVNARDMRDETPLLATAGLVGVASLLLQEGAEVGCRNVDGNTPLMLGAIRGDVQMIELLRRHGASIFSHNLTLESALHLASGNGQTSVVSWLLAQPQVPEVLLDARDLGEFTPAHRAALGGHTDCLEMLSNAGADLDATSSAATGRSTVLHHAADQAWPGCVLRCLRGGAEHLSVDGNGATPLRRAARALPGPGRPPRVLETTKLLLAAAVQRCEAECFGPSSLPC